MAVLTLALGIGAIPAERGAKEPEYCGGPTGYRLMLKRQKEGESMGTPAQVEVVIAMLTASHPDQPASSWDLLREAMDDGMRSIDQRLEQYGPLEPNRFSLKEVPPRKTDCTIVRAGSRCLASK